MDQDTAEWLADLTVSLRELISEVEELSALVAELGALSLEQSRGVTAAESEYTLPLQKLLTQKARLSYLISHLPPESGIEEE